MSKPVKEKFLVLVADDSADDRLLFRRAVEPTARLQIIAEASDGVEAIAYLNCRTAPAHYAEFPVPDLLLLDLKMPNKDGFEVLEWLQTQSFPNLTVVVMTDSVQAEHIQRALNLGAHLFQVKPRSNQELTSVIHALEEFLLNRPRHSLPVRTSTQRLPRIAAAA